MRYFHLSVVAPEHWRIRWHTIDALILATCSSASRIHRVLCHNHMSRARTHDYDTITQFYKPMRISGNERPRACVPKAHFYTPAFR